ncbi:SRPBCC domain-containing protein [Brevundimonas sp. BR2-1]|uniref:SRPBCC family protein n=1 Tax=unclassified Brevundimonas TaxID=2622653 RepID=UPI002FCA342C
MSRVRVEKLFRHPPERVFDAFLDPARVGEWLYATPSGVMEHVLYEPRAGGRIEVFERRGEELAEHHGAFVDIDRPRRIVFETRYSDDPPVLVTVTFSARGDGCLVVLEHALPAEWAHFVEGASKGWAMILDNLERVTETGR